MSERDSGSIFCCCRRPNSPSKYAPNLESRLNLKEEAGFDDASISVTVPPTEASKSRDETEMWVSGSFTSEEKSLDVQQQQAEAENGNDGYQSQNRDADTLVLPSRLKSSSAVENEAGTAAENVAAAEVPTVEVLLSSGDALRLSGEELMASGGRTASEYLVNFEKIIERLEAVADQLESRSGINNATQDVATTGHVIEQQCSHAVSPIDRDPPSTILTNGQWNVENHSGNRDLVLKITDDLQSVKIRDCNECTIHIEGKPESIAISNCVKCGIVFQEASKPLTIADCQRIQIQVLDAVPSINARNTDGLSIYLNKQSQDLPVFGFKCSELNLLVPQDDGDFKEISIPEQFQSHWNGDRWVTSIADIMN